MKQFPNQRMQFIVRRGSFPSDYDVRWIANSTFPPYGWEIVSADDAYRLIYEERKRRIESPMSSGAAPIYILPYGRTEDELEGFSWDGILVEG